MNEVEYLNMKNYGDQGGCYQLITPFEISIILHMIRKPKAAKFFQIWSSVAGYGELCLCF